MQYKKVALYIEWCVLWCVWMNHRFIRISEYLFENHDGAHFYLAYSQLSRSLG